MFHLLSGLVSFLGPQLNRCKLRQLGEMRTFFLSLPPLLSFQLPPLTQPHEATSHFLPLIQKLHSLLCVLHAAKGSAPGQGTQLQEGGKQWLSTAPSLSVLFGGV